jgi:hypothetical protein
MKTNPEKERTLLATWTNEPVQPCGSTTPFRAAVS